MDQDIPPLCESVLKKIFGNKLDSSTIAIQGRGTAGEGYSNEMIYLSVKFEDKELFLAVKIMLDFKSADFKKAIGGLYDTEIQFYETIWPALDTFQKTCQQCQPFDKIPKFYGSLTENGRGVLVMENLKASNFVLREKKHMYDRSLVELLFKNFGHFHALSLALKQKDRTQFDRLAGLLTSSWNSLLSMETFGTMLTKIAETATSGLEEGDRKERMKTFSANVVEEFKETTIYSGSNHVILHGDCWINNFLFKCKKSGEIEDLRCLDFQVNQLGTPVYDLSYCFYSGATKELLEDLDHFLLVYYSSLSSKLREFDCDVHTLYPFKLLKEEWKQYSKVGFIMGLMIWRGKTSENVIDLTDFDDVDVPMDGMICDEEMYSSIVGDLIDHMITNKFI